MRPNSPRGPKVSSRISELFQDLQADLAFKILFAISLALLTKILQVEHAFSLELEALGVTRK